MEAFTVPADLLPLPALPTRRSSELTVTVLVPPAVPLIVTPAPVKPLTGSLKTAVKLIGEALVGSAWPAAWLIVTVGGLALETVTVTGAEAVRRPAASRATAVKVCGPL